MDYDRDVQKLCFQGLLLWGALYVYFVFVMAGYQGNRLAQCAVVAAAGASYVDYMLMLSLPESKRIHITVFFCSVTAAVAAGLLLLR